MGRCVVLVGAMMLAACIEDAPLTVTEELDELCEGTEPGRACITLVPTATEEVIELLEGETEGAFAWALYEDGEVGPLGPENVEEWIIADEFILDLLDEEDARSVTLVDFEPGWFQVLGYFRPLPLDEPGEGDAVTLPKSGFEAPADAHTRVEVELDFVR